MLFNYKVIKCPAPKQRANMDIQFKCQTFGCQANYTCKETFDLILGDSIRHCNGSGQWSGDDPICDKKVVMCHLPVQLEYSVCKIDSLLVNSVANYSCAEGFELIEGNLRRKCLQNQTWSGQPAKCQRKPSNQRVFHTYNY